MEDARYGGLTQKEVKERINAGKTNQSDASTGLTVKQIILSNTLTYFNLIFLVITVLLCIVGSFANYPVEHHHRDHSGMARQKNA